MTRSLKRSLIIAIGFVAVIWAIKIVEVICGFDFRSYGVLPGDVAGLVGIATAPLIHGSWSHLASNSPPLIVLTTSLLYGYPRAAKIAIPAILIGAGLGVWLFARATYHIGASGLTFGMMFFIFTIGALRWDRRAIALSMLVFFLYGSMIWGIFPRDPRISFEMHFFGALSGVCLAFALKRLDPAPPIQRYSWEGEDDDDGNNSADHDQR